jgi:hypothetical protein
MSDRNDQPETEIYGSPAQFRTLPDGSMQWMKEFVRGLDGKIVADGKWRPCLSDQEWEQWFANRPPMFQPITSILSDADRERIAEEVESFKKARKEEEETRKKMDEFRAKLKQNAQQSTRSKKDLLWMDTETTGPWFEQNQGLERPFHLPCVTVRANDSNVDHLMLDTKACCFRVHPQQVFF